MLTGTCSLALTTGVPPWMLPFQPNDSAPHQDSIHLLLDQLDAMHAYHDTDLVFVATAVQKVGLAGVPRAKVVADPESLQDIDIYGKRRKKDAATAPRPTQLPNHDQASLVGGYRGAAGGPVRFTPRWWFLRMNKPRRVRQRAHFASLKSTVCGARVCQVPEVQA